MLHESQEEIKELRSKNTPSAGLRRPLSYRLYPMVRNTDLLLHTSISLIHVCLVKLSFFQSHLFLIQAISVICTCNALLDIVNALLFTLQSSIYFHKHFNHYTFIIVHGIWCRSCVLMGGYCNLGYK